MQVQFLWLPQKCPTSAANNKLRCCLALIAEFQLDPPLFLPFSARSYDTPPNAIWPNANSTKTLRDIYENLFWVLYHDIFYILVLAESAQSCFNLYIWPIAIWSIVIWWIVRTPSTMAPSETSSIKLFVLVIWTKV